MLDTAPAPTTSNTSTGLTHIYCCDPDLALCGEDLTDIPEVDEDTLLCVVCDDLEDHPCTCTLEAI